jgi:hypothetical protein
MKIVVVLVLVFCVAVGAFGQTTPDKMDEVESNRAVMTDYTERAVYTVLVEILKQLNAIESAIHETKRTK